MIVLSLLLLITLQVWLSEQVCAPDCSLANDGDFVRDPTDCTRFYVCSIITSEMHPSEDPIDCLSGFYFDATTASCTAFPSSGTTFCTDLCDPCGIDCTVLNPGTYQPHPTDCARRYICLQGGGYVEDNPCPATAPYYDYGGQECSTDPSLCYDYCDICLPHCIASGQLVRDPYDCHKYYECEPPYKAHYECPHNEVFNPDTQKCDTATTCEVLCLETV